MKKDDNLQGLAGEMLELWQEQFTATMKDPETIGKTMELFYMMQQQFFKQAAHATSNNNTPADSDTTPVEHSQPSLPELIKRVAKLEGQVKKLKARVSTQTRKRAKKSLAS